MSEEFFYARLDWQPMGLPFKYKEYSRTYNIRVQGKPDMLGTAAPNYFGSKYQHNPEDFLVISLSACHMLSYLAYAANSKIEVLSYSDKAEGILHKDGKIMKFKGVILRPEIKISSDSDLKKAEELHDKAHHACFIANSVNFPVKIEPVFTS